MRVLRDSSFVVLVDYTAYDYVCVWVCVCMDMFGDVHCDILMRVCILSLEPSWSRRSTSPCDMCDAMRTCVICLRLWEHVCDMCGAMRTCVICVVLWEHVWYVWCYENMCDMCGAIHARWMGKCNDCACVIFVYVCDDCWFLLVWPLVMVTVIICVGPLITGYSTLPLYVYVLVDFYINTWATFPIWACLDSYVCGTRM